MAQANPTNTCITNMSGTCIYKDAHEKHVKTHVAYTPNFGEDRTLYKEPECITPLMPMELYNMFLDGMVIQRTANIYKPFRAYLDEDNFQCFVSIVNDSSTFSILEYHSAPDDTVDTGR